MLPGCVRSFLSGGVPLSVVSASAVEGLRADASAFFGGGKPVEAGDFYDLIEVRGADGDGFGSVARVSFSGFVLKRGGGMPGVADLSMLGENLERAEAEADAAVLVIDSPGGSVVGLPEARRKIEAVMGTGMPVVSYTDSLCASAGYYLAAATGGVFAAESAMVGSIGTFIGGYDLSKAFEKDGIEAITFASGDLKGMGFMGAEVTEAQRAHLQSVVDVAAEDFFAFVRERRGAVTDDSMRGQVFTGAEAGARGLVDGLADDLSMLVRGLMKG